MDFVAVDWGSTRFRAYRVGESGVSARLSSEAGILATPREALAAALVTALAPWRAWIEREGVPVRMAGMIGSSAGLRDAGYQRLPIFLDELAATSAEVEVTTPLATRVGIRPGLALVDGDTFDVLRGEEVQLLGAVRLMPAELYVFPGSHSKWVPVERAAGRARADLSHAGGITECVKIASMADAYDVGLAPHCPLGPVALAACLAVDFVAHNAVLQEQSGGIHYNQGAELLDYVRNKDDFRIEGGFIAPLPLPGLGVDVDEPAVIEASKRAGDWRNPLWRHDDGAVAEW